MKKFIGIFMIICLMATLCLVACNTHEHTFSEAWEHDDTYHWHAATCGHTDEVDAKGKHIFVENTCKTCGYVRTQDEHKHTFSEEWEHDETKHWHKATCGHSDLKSEEGGHTFVDGKCSVCGYEKKEEDEHKHTFSDKWSYDETKHWHEAICGHKDVRSDESDHTFVDGKCSVCGYVKKEEEEHKHTFSDKWEHDDTKHWHEATCEHEGLKSEESDHVFENGKCIVCGYQHVHEFSEEWTTNLTYHWHASTCGHDVVEGMEAHNFEDGVCTVCSFVKPTEQHVHDEKLTEVAGKEPTCTEKGLKAHLKCESCGTLFDKETREEVEYNSLVIDAKGHKKPLIVHDEVKATCVSGGNSKYYECDVCKALFEDENAETLTDLANMTTEANPDNHSLHHVDEVKGDCSKHGTRAYRECEYCKTKFDEDGDVLTDEDLDLGYGEHGNIIYSAGSDPTCTTAGLNEYYYCDNCKTKFSDPLGRYEITQENYLQVPATGHSYVNQVPVSKDASGHTRICRDCDAHEKGDDGEVVLPHKFGENGGTYCVECGYVKDGSLPETGEIYLDGLIYEYDNSDNHATLKGAYEPDGGYRDDYVIAGKIEFGGKTYTVTEIGNNALMRGGGLPRDLSSVVIPETVTTIKANAFSGQTKLNKVVMYNTITSLDSSAFNNCGWLIIYFKGDKTELESNDALKSLSSKARYYTETKPETDISNYWHFTDKHHEQAELYKDTFEWFDCSNGIVYKIDETNDTATAVRVELKTQNVSIPKEIYVKEDTYTVTSIAENLFNGNTVLKSVDIGDGVVTIMDYAFAECASLESVVLGKELTNIADYAFYHCENLQSIVIPKKVTRIGTSAFNSCVLFESLEIPDSVTQIGDRAFSLCSGVKTIKIGKGLNSFAYMTFYGMPQLESIEVSSENTHYFSENNCIVERSTNTLALGCKNSVIPESVTIIGNGAFYGCTALTRIVIPSKVTRITSVAFMNCSGLVEVIIKGNVKDIRDSAFSGCSSLESIVIPSSLQVITMSAFANTSIQHVYYTGTKTQWESLQKSGDVKDKTLFSAPVYFYSATEPSESESYDPTLNYWHYDSDGEKIIVWNKKS